MTKRLNGCIAKMFLVCVFVLLGLGCASVGPIKVAEDFNQAMRASVDLRGEPIQQYGRAEWCPGADKYDFKAEQGSYRSGVLVLQDTRLLFVAWNVKTKRYEILHEIVYANARDVRRRVWGASQRLVIETADGRTDAFSFVSSNGQFVSRPCINQAIAFLQTKIPTDKKEESNKSPNLYTELTKLDDLRKKGILTEEEFQAQKKLILEKQK